jgi:hypothetical protein
MRRTDLKDVVNEIKELRDSEEPGDMIVGGHQRKHCEDHIVLFELCEERESVVLKNARRCEGSEDAEVLGSLFSLDDESNEYVFSFG